MSMTIYLYWAATVWTADKGTVLEMLAAMLQMFTVCTRVKAFVERHPDFNDNPFKRVMCGDDYQPEVARDFIIGMIDKRADGLTEEQLNSMMDTTA